MASMTSSLYKLARLSATAHAATTGHLTRRVKNIAAGRALGRGGVWRRLWR